MPLPYVVSCDILGAASLVLWRAVFAHAVPAGACHKRPAMCWAVQGSVGSGGIGGTHDVYVCVGGGGGVGLCWAGAGAVHAWLVSEADGCLG